MSKSNVVAPFPKRRGLYIGPRRFSFLNIEHDFVNAVDWDYLKYGKLWAYNLNYFDFLLDENMNRSEGLALMDAFMDTVEHLKNANEPYPISLRVFNWIKYLQENEIQDVKYTSFVASDLDLLSRMLEYHIMGNHLLENGFALYFGGLIIGLDQYSSLGKRMLVSELNEQILEDGGHFERSPMYHTILLERLLDCVNAAIPNEKDESFLEFLTLKAQKMIDWINAFSFQDKSYAMVNDAADGIAKDVNSILNYANRLGLDISRKADLDESGYRRINKSTFELLIDAGDIGPNYLPAHAHCDTLSFVLHVNGHPFIVDTGTSTYENDDRRQLERSTSSHNTVMISNTEQSEIWGAFRVARRAYGKVLEESDSELVATHTGFERIDANHTRTFEWNDNSIVIYDKATTGFDSEAFLHFHEAVNVELSGNQIRTQFGTIQIEHADSIALEQFELCKGFNHRVTSHKVCISFKSFLKTSILIN